MVLKKKKKKPQEVFQSDLELPVLTIKPQTVPVLVVNVSCPVHGSSQRHKMSVGRTTASTSC